MVISETIDSDTITKIILYRIELQEKTGETGWIGTDDPFQRIVLNIIASNKYPQKEVIEWAAKQEEIIKEKAKTIFDDLAKGG